MTKIQWSRLAIEDLQALRAHVAEHDPAAAKHLAETIVLGCFRNMKKSDVQAASR